MCTVSFNHLFAPIFLKIVLLLFKLRILKLQRAAILPDRPLNMLFKAFLVTGGDFQGYGDISMIPFHLFLVGCRFRHFFETAIPNMLIEVLRVLLPLSPICLICPSEFRYFILPRGMVVTRPDSPKTRMCLPPSLTENPRRIATFLRCLPLTSITETSLLLREIQYVPNTVPLRLLCFQ